MTEQIDNLLTPRVMVTNPWPGMSSHFKVGQVIVLSEMEERPHIKREPYALVKGSEGIMPDSRTFYLSEALKYPHLFREMHWSEGREPEQMPRYLRNGDEIVEVKKHFSAGSGDWRSDSIRVCCFERDGRTVSVTYQGTTPATSDQYLEYLTQQSKP